MNRPLIHILRGLFTYWIASIKYDKTLAVDRTCQRRGIGAELIRRTKEASGGNGIALLLLSAPDGMGYYPKVGLEKFDNCFGIHRTREPDRRL